MHKLRVSFDVPIPTHMWGSDSIEDLRDLFLQELINNDITLDDLWDSDSSINVQVIR